MFAVLGPDPVIGFLAPVLLGAIAVTATYFLGKEAGGRRVGLASAALIATTPLIVRFSRSFQFSIPATAITTLALLSLLKSDRAGRWPWVIAFGVFVGLMPLARSMTIGFIPCIGAAALVCVIFEKDRLARIARLAIASVVAVLTSLTWLWKSGSLVWRYLYDFGYGNRVAE
jgi:4-amino-4-deoxy-L-arabinose transferase-like glycosyltransferase